MSAPTRIHIFPTGKRLHEWIAFEEGYVKAGEAVVITVGVPLGSPGATNMIRLAYVDERGLPDGHDPDALPVGGKKIARPAV
mgnify:CR=1 FL=1